MICLKHSQQYNSDEFCIYCDYPYKEVTVTGTAYTCYGKCHTAKKGEVFTCGCPCCLEKWNNKNMK